MGGVCLSLILQTLSCKPRYGHDDAFASCANCVTGIEHIPVLRSAWLFTVSRVGSLLLAD